MSATMRAKMQVMSVKNIEPWPGTDSPPTQEITMNPVCGKFNEDGDSEDNTYARYTPTGRIDLTVNNPVLVGKIHPGQTFYVDFIEVQE